MANKKLSATVTIGGAISSTLGASMRYATNEIGRVSAAIRNQTRETFQLGAATKAYEQQSKAMMRAERNRELASAGRKSLATAGVAFGVAGAAIGAAAFPVKAAIDFETAMLGVAKQVDGARDASGRLTPIYFQLGKEIQALGRTIPMATNNLAAMVAAGARMNIPREELIEFTKTAAMMAEAFELPAAELADRMGKIKKLFGLGTQAEVTALADSINYLDDNAISKGGDIIDFLTRTGGLAGSVKVTGSQMAALGSTLLTLGERTETAGTAVNAIFGKLASGDKGTKKFRAAMKELGLSTREVQQGMQVDAQGTLLQVLEKVQKLPKANQLGVLTELVGLEHSDTLAKLANGIGEYRKQIDLANATAAKGSMAKENAARMATTEAQLKILKNELTELSVVLGNRLLPMIKEVIPKIGDAVKGTADWVSANKDTIIWLGKAAGALLGGALAFGTITGAVGAFKLGLVGVGAVMKANPIGLTISALVAGATLVYEHWDWVRGVFVAIGDAIGKVWGQTKDFFAGFGGYESKKRYDAERAKEKAALGPSMHEWDQYIAPPRGATNSSSVNATINITQQPGQDSKALAELVAAELAKRGSVKQRSANYDAPGAF